MSRVGRHARGQVFHSLAPPISARFVVGKQGARSVEGVAPSGSGGACVTCEAARVWEREDRFTGSLGAAEWASIVGLSIENRCAFGGWHER